MKIGETLYYARILDRVGVYEVEEVHIRMIGDTWFSAIENINKQVFLFNKKDIGESVFEDRYEALMKVKAAESSATTRIFTEYTEE